VRRLAERPDLRAACEAEVRAHGGDGPLTMESLDRLSACTNVVLEAKRIVPLVPLAFGRARRPFSCGGYRIPQGWRVYLALHLNNHDPRVFERPDAFDPDRFAPGRAEHRRHPMAFIPQGAEPPTGHRCLGLDYSTTLVLTFLTLLVRGYDWELPAQDLRPDWRKAPPDPRDGLRVRLRTRV
jgi:cytochrome P450